LAGCRGDCARGAEGRGCAQDGADIAGILNAGEDNQKRGTSGGCWRTKQVIECGYARLN
jgi:hypothetical protein